MPIPKPKPGEDKQKFVGRCMGDATMNKDYPDQKQRAAICYGQVKTNSFPGHAGRPGQVGGSSPSGGKNADVPDFKKISAADLPGMGAYLEQYQKNAIADNYEMISVPITKAFGTEYSKWGGLKHDDPTVKEMRETLKNGYRLPVMEGAVQKDGRVKIIDGQHRLLAHRLERGDQAHVPVIVFKEKVKNNMETYSQPVPNYTVEKVTHQGRQFLVVPVNMMTEGVHKGSHGAVFHSIDELGKFPASWNGIPVTIQHPKDPQGNPISANSPDVIDGTTVGRVYHTNVDGDVLKSKAYLDEQRLRQVSPLAAEYIDKGLPLEVSLGMFTEDEPNQGVWRNEQYNAVATNHRPDHLALLPGGRGACSWADGCGIRANEEENENNDMNTNEKGDNSMSDKQTDKNPCCPEKVELLIQDENSRFTEDDREFLLTLSADQLEKVQPVTVEVEKIVEVEKKVQINDDEMTTKVKEVLANSFADQATFINLLPPEIKDQVQSGLKLHSEMRAGMIQSILTNQSSEVFTKEELDALPAAQLQKLADAMRPKAYRMSAGGGGVNANEEKLLPPGIA